MNRADTPRGGPDLRTALAVVVMIAVLGVVVIVGGRVALEYDEAVYLGIAEQIRLQACPIRPRGPGEVYLNNPPLVMYVEALLGLVLDSVGALRIGSVVVWVVPLLGFTVALARRLFGSSAALLCALSVATQTRFLSEAAVAKLDVPLATLSMAFVWVVHRRSGPVQLGTIAALATVCRYQGALLGITGFVVLAWQARARGHRWREVAWGRPGACLLGAGLGGAVWIGLATVCGGDFGAALAGNLGRLAAHSEEPWFHRPLLDYWRSLALDWIGPFVLGAVAVALLVRGRGILADPTRVVLVAWILVNLAFCSSIALKAERYFVPAMPAACIVASGVVADRDDWRWGVPEAVRGAIRRWLLVGGICAAALGMVVAALRVSEREPAGAYRDAAAQVEALTATEDRVMVAQVQVAYLAGRHYYVSLFEPDPDVVLSWLRDPRARVVVIAADDRILAYHPNMAHTDKARIVGYVQEHFERIPTDTPHLMLWRRTSW